MLLKTRLLLLLAASVVAMAVLGAAATRADHVALQRMVSIEERDHRRLLRSVVSHYSGARASWSFDNSFWDDAVTFVTDGGTDAAWADENLGSSLEQIQADAVIVYAADGHCVYASTTSLGADAPARIDAAMLLRGAPVKHVYIDGAGELLEVHSATIVPSSDRPHATPPVGALVVVKAWDANTMNALSLATDATVTLLPPDAPMESSNLEQISAEVPLAGADGAPVARLRSQGATMLQTLAAQRESATRTTIGLMMLVALGLTLAVQRWVLVPMARLSDALAEREAGPLRGLDGARDEFGALSRLVVHYFAQSEAMAAAMAVRIEAEAAVTRSLHEKEVLLREIHHRVKNNLQIISSLLTMQSQQMASVEARTLLEESVHRVRSMALVHQQLYGVDSLERIDLGVYAQALAGTLRGSLAPQCKLRIDADTVIVSVDIAVPMALILNELLTNAFKYGAKPAEDDPTADWDVWVRITGDAARFAITVRDRGPGLPHGFSLTNSDTLGLQLMRALCRQTHSRMTASNDGGACFHLECAPRPADR